MIVKKGLPKESKPGIGALLRQDIMETAIIILIILT